MVAMAWKASSEGVLSGVFHVPLVPGEEGRVQEHEAAY